MIFLILAILFVAYFVALQIAAPGTLFSLLFNFSTVYLLLAAVCIVLFALRKRHLWKNAKKSTKIAILSICGAGLLISVVNLAFICTPKLADGSEQCDYVILLGGGITKDKKLSDVVQRRVKAAATYLQAHPNALVVVTGGQGPAAPCPESDVLKPALAAYGIEESRILAENQARDTIQNFKFSAVLLSDYTGLSIQEILDAPITIITSDFHLARAQRLAKRMGFSNFCGVQSKTPAFFVPNVYAREICSYIKLNLRIFFTHEPKKLEEPTNEQFLREQKCETSFYPYSLEKQLVLIPRLQHEKSYS